MRTAMCLLALGILSFGCGDDDSSGGVDAGSDSSMPSDAGGDAGTEVDAGQDAGADEDAPPVEDTWETFGENFFATYCVECHSGGRRDYRTIDDVMRDQDRIRCGTSDVALADCSSPPPRQFPIGSGPSPSDEERQRLVAWIDAGLP